MKKLLNGFTLIELLIVVSTIGILAGISYALINVERQEEIAQEGVIQANMHALVQSIESFHAGEGRYPADNADPALVTYVSKWPDEPNTYEYTLVNDGDDFTVSVEKTAGSGFFKYYSQWGEIRSCANVDPLVPGSCDAGSEP